MKVFLFRAAIIAALAGAFLFLLDSRVPEQPTDLLDVLDALVDTGLTDVIDLESPGFFERRSIISTTDVNAE
ncbi:MAG: hypothetical protein AAF357_19540, partial [Verrucomicrobiota bacterium]